MRITDEQIEKAFKKQEKRGWFKKGYSEFFWMLAKYHIPYLHDIAKKYKESGLIGLHTFYLADYYQTPKDKEIALFASLYVSKNGAIRKQAQHIRKIMGKSPAIWYEKRKFVSLALGKNQKKRIEVGGHQYWKLAELFQRFWEIEHPANGRRTDMESEVLALMQENDWSAEKALLYLFDGIDLPLDSEWKIRMLLICLFRRDGFGYGLWGFGDEPLNVPWSRLTYSFLKEWLPDYRKYGSKDECVKLFRFDDDVDFLYATLGYNKMRKLYPAECSHYSTLYSYRYRLGNRKNIFIMYNAMPPIEFGE